MRLNVNEHIRVVITKHGLNQIETRGVELFRNEIPHGCLQESDFQLWRFCEVFGPLFTIGITSNGPLIKENTIVIGDANEHV